MAGLQLKSTCYKYIIKIIQENYLEWKQKTETKTKGEKARQREKRRQKRRLKQICFRILPDSLE